MRTEDWEKEFDERFVSKTPWVDVITGKSKRLIQMEVDPRTIKAFIHEVWQAAQQEAAREIIKDLKSGRQAITEGYGRDENWKYQGVKKMWGIVRAILDHYEPEEDKINRAKSRARLKKNKSKYSLSAEQEKEEPKRDECHCHYVEHNKLFCKCMQISCEHCRKQ